MSRAFLAAVIAALALPVVALAALIGQQELRLADARILSVPLIGYDPRDLLQGRYIVARLDWTWEHEPATELFGGTDGTLCVLETSPKPRVRFVPGHKTDGACMLVIVGKGWIDPPRFAPSGLDDGYGSVRFYVPETRAAELEKLMNDRPGALTADLAVRADGNAAIKALRVDGQVVVGR